VFSVIAPGTGFLFRRLLRLAGLRLRYSTPLTYSSCVDGLSYVEVLLINTEAVS
jgi:hypothetical protein